MKHLSFLLLLLFGSLSVAAQKPLDRSAADRLPRREFRGAWIQAVNGQFMGMSRDVMQQNLTHQLDVLAQCGVNVIIFQVRCEADALYASPLEPWSRFLTGKQGTPPNPYWDPLAWITQECHRRGMEIHAWINPYRAKTKGTTELSTIHPYVQHPERFFSYGGLLLFDPGLQENANYICHVASDIVRRYDVDGLHIDDYFYPYPEAGKAIPDEKTFAAHNDGLQNIAEWRRHNVNHFIKQLSDSIHTAKPWVKFGVSPFGIYHNAKNGDGVPGSNTNGLQNYDDLYADVLLWTNKGWVDYVVPQLYWQIGHPQADYEELVHWWAKYAGARPLIIGQDIERTAKYADTERTETLPGGGVQNQMEQKIALQRAERTVRGSCLWYAAACVRDEGGYATALRTRFHRFPALQPLFPFLDNDAPGKPTRLKVMTMPDGKYLFWTTPKLKGAAKKAPVGSAAHEMGEAKSYAVYHYNIGEPFDALEPQHLIAITTQTLLRLPEHGSGTYFVVALDRLQNESPAAKKKIR